MSCLYAISVKEIPQLVSWVLSCKKKTYFLIQASRGRFRFIIPLENYFEKVIKTVHNRIHNESGTYRASYGASCREPRYSDLFGLG